MWVGSSLVARQPEPQTHSFEKVESMGQEDECVHGYAVASAVL